VFASGIATIIASIIVGAALGAVTFVGLVNSQTSAPSDSPGNVSDAVIDYGSNS